LQGTVRWNFERSGVVCEVVAPWDLQTLA
jgi:hypothetical protein